MKRVYLAVIITSALTLLYFSHTFSFWDSGIGLSTLKVGFIYENDESMPYTYNFVAAERALEEQYGRKVQILTKSNTLEEETEEPVRDLVRSGCNILFTNGYSGQFMELASEYPDVQFCQISYMEQPPETAPENYHTFNGEIYQGRYAGGVVAGMKLRELLDRRLIAPGEARVGYVAAYPTAEVISGFTAFFLGVRSVAPEADMRVRYTGTWGSYSKERDAAKRLIREGCVVLSQHTDTIAPAVACEEAALRHTVYFVGYNEGMMDVAPTTALISTRINWKPYILSAVDAVFKGETIEKNVDGNVHGNDVSAGFERGWVEMLDLNTYIAADGTEQKLNETIENLKRGTIQVFRGDYIGVNPEDPSDICDLSTGFQENASYSSPSFHYILKGAIVERNRLKS